MRIGFLGLGPMGSRMASRLLDASYELSVWNRHPASAQALVDKGARLLATPRAAAEGAGVVIASVRDDDASRAVWAPWTLKRRRSNAAP